MLRRVEFVPNEPGQLFVAERDGVHESDTRRGISLYDSTIGHVNDDFFNVHTMLLVVMGCRHADGPDSANLGTASTRCLLVNPHVIGSGWTTTYGGFVTTAVVVAATTLALRCSPCALAVVAVLLFLNAQALSLSLSPSPSPSLSLVGGYSVLQNARAGDTLSFFPLIKKDEKPPPTKLAPLNDEPAVLSSMAKVTDPAVLREAVALSVTLGKDHNNNVMWFAGPGTEPSDCYTTPKCEHLVDVWQVTVSNAVLHGLRIPNGTLVSVNELGCAGSRFIGNRFINTTCSARWKGSNAVFANNTFSQSGIANLEITYLQPWMEGPALIEDVLFDNNTFHYGEGFNPIHPNAVDTTGIAERNNRFLGDSGDFEHSRVKSDDGTATNLSMTFSPPFLISNTSENCGMVPAAERWPLSRPAERQHCESGLIF